MCLYNWMSICGVHVYMYTCGDGERKGGEERRAKEMEMALRQEV